MAKPVLNRACSMRTGTRRTHDHVTGSPVRRTSRQSARMDHEYEMVSASVAEIGIAARGKLT